MQEQNMYAVMVWPTDENKLSVHSLSKIKEPLKPWNEYKVGEKGKASFTGFKELWPFEILAVGASKKDMDGKLEKIIQDRLENPAANSETGNNPVLQESLAEDQNLNMQKDQQKTARKRKPKQQDKTNRNKENDKEKTKPIKKRKVKSIATKSNGIVHDSDSDSEKDCLVDENTKRKAIKSAVTTLLSNRSGSVNAVSVAQQNVSTVSAPVVPKNLPHIVQNSCSEIQQTSVSVAQHNTTPNVQQHSAPVVQQNHVPTIQHNSTFVNKDPTIQQNSTFVNKDPTIQQNSTFVNKDPTVQQNPASFVQQNFTSGTNAGLQNFSTGSTFQQNFTAPAYSNNPFHGNYGMLSTTTAPGMPGDFNSSFGYISTYTSTPNEKTFFNNESHSLNSETLDSYSSGIQDSSSLISNARKTLYGETDMLETNQQNIPHGSTCHSCCLQVQALQNDVALLKKAFEKMKKKNKKGEPASSTQSEISDTNGEEGPIVFEPELINGHTKEHIEKAAKESPNLTEAVRLTMGLCFTVKELIECSLTGQRKNVKENKDPRPGLDDNRRIYLEGLLGRLFSKDIKEIRGKMRDRLKLFRRSHSGL